MGAAARQASTQAWSKAEDQGCEHADIWKDRDIIFTMAVTVGGYIHDQGNMEVWPSVNYSFGVFSHAAVEKGIGRRCH